MEKLDVVNAALGALKAGKTCELVVVAGTAGSSPRGVGAWMAVFADGSQAGTIGGGKIELFALDEARELLAGGKSRLVRYTMGGENSDTGMICGGAICLCYLHLDATRHRCSSRLPTSWPIGASATSSSTLNRLSQVRMKATLPNTMARSRAAP